MTHTGLIHQLRESARYRSGLHAAASLYFEQSYYGELTPAAIRKLKKVERRAVALALGLFAHDVHCTTAEIVAKSLDGDNLKAREEKAALTARTLGKWALNRAGFSCRSSLCELADPLGIGLGKELQVWLLNREFKPSEAASWVQEFGPQIERFIKFLKR